MFSEDFEISITAGEALEIYGLDDYKPEFIESVIEDLRIAGLETAGVKTETRSYGYGADSMGLGIILVSLTSFLLGKKIEENLDAWISLGKRLCKFISRIRNRKFNVLISEPLAAALAIDNIASEDENLSSISILSNTKIPIPNPSLNPDFELFFKYQPDCYYIFVLKCDRFIRVVGISSYGLIIFNQKLPLNFYAFNYSNI